MPVSQKTVTVGTSATALFNSAQNRRRFVLHNDSGATVYVGGPSVTTSTGHVVSNNATFEIQQQFSTDASAKYQWYAVSAAGGAVVRVIEVTG